MTRVCTVCAHNDIALIDDAIVSREPLKQIADEYGLSYEALRRHARPESRGGSGCLSRTIAKAHEADEAARASDLIAELRAVRDEMVRLAEAAEENDDILAAMRGHSYRFKYVELLAEIRGLIDRAAKVNVLALPAWFVVKDVLANLDERYPGATEEIEREIRRRLEALPSPDSRSRP